MKKTSWTELSNTIRRFRAGITGLCLAAAVLTMTAATTLGQTANRPDRGVRPTGSYSVSDIENINMNNGNLNVSIPLASLPPIAGGKLSWTLAAHYNSKAWDMYRTQEESTVTT